jgi:hypothetical protein
MGRFHVECARRVAHPRWLRLAAGVLCWSLGSLVAHADLINVVQGHGASTTQSTTLAPQYGPGNAADGVTGNFTHTMASDPNPTWEVNLGATVYLDNVTILNRGDGCCQSRLRDVTVSVLDFNGATVYTSPLLNPENTLGGGGTAGPAQLSLAGLNVYGRTIRVTRTPDPDNSGTGGQGNADEGFILSMGEVMAQANNLAYNRPATSSSDIGFPPSNGTNGVLGDFTHTAGVDLTPSWQVDLGTLSSIDSVVIHNRDGCCNGRLRDINIDILAADGTTVVYTSPMLNEANVLGGGPNDYNGGPETLALDLHALLGGTVDGQYVRVRRTPSAIVTGNPDDATVLSMGEVQVFGSPVPEPSTYALAVIGGTMFVAARRRRKSV